MPILKHHYRGNSDFSLSKERRLAYMAIGRPSAAPAVAPARGWAKVGMIFRKMGRAIASPLRLPATGLYWASGGGAIHFVAKTVVKGFSAMGNGLVWVGDKVNEGGNYGAGFTRGVAGGAWEAGATSSWTFAKAFPRDYWMSTAGVGWESTKTYGQVLKSPLNLASGVRQFLFGDPGTTESTGLFGRPLSIAKNLATFNFRNAIDETLNLYPIAMARKALTLNFREAARTTRSKISDILAPIHRPVMPVVRQARAVIAKAIESKTQYWDSLKDAVGHTRNGFQGILAAPEMGSLYAARYRAEVDLRKARILQEEATLEAANNPPVGGQNMAAAAA